MLNIEHELFVETERRRGQLRQAEQYRLTKMAHSKSGRFLPLQLIVSALSLFASLVVLFLPETSGRTLDELPQGKPYLGTHI